MIAYALCWGLNIDIAGILFFDLISKLTSGGKKRRERNPLILLSEEVNVEGTDDKSSSGTVVHPASQPKVKIDKKLRKEKIPSSSGPKVSKTVMVQTPTLEASESQPA
ncbi:hypothetical protein Tco_0832124 [Tanacetum coccineum]